jgi:hypothetical protein
LYPDLGEISLSWLFAVLLPIAACVVLAVEIVVQVFRSFSSALLDLYGWEKLKFLSPLAESGEI